MHMSSTASASSAAASFGHVMHDHHWVQALVTEFEGWASVDADTSMQFDWDDLAGVPHAVPARFTHVRIAVTSHRAHSPLRGMSRRQRWMFAR